MNKLASSLTGPLMYFRRNTNPFSRFYKAAARFILIAGLKLKVENWFFLNSQFKKKTLHLDCQTFFSCRIYQITLSKQPVLRGPCATWPKLPQQVKSFSLLNLVTGIAVIKSLTNWSRSSSSKEHPVLRGPHTLTHIALEDRIILIAQFDSMQSHHQYH